MFDGTKAPRETRLKDIYHCLAQEEIDVYFQGQHRGNCVKPYVVIVSRGESKVIGYSSTATTVEILCYVPLKTPSELDIFVDKVKQALKYLKPMLKNIYSDIGDYVDDDVKAVMRTLQYSYYRKIEE